MSAQHTEPLLVKLAFIARFRSQIVQDWILTFPNLELLDPQLDEAKLALGVVRNIEEIANSDSSTWWGAIDTLDTRKGGTIRIPGRPWQFSTDKLEHLGVPAFRVKRTLAAKNRAADVNQQ